MALLFSLHSAAHKGIPARALSAFCAAGLSCPYPPPLLPAPAPAPHIHSRKQGPATKALPSSSPPSLLSLFVSLCHMATAFVPPSLSESTSKPPNSL